MSTVGEWIVLDLRNIGNTGSMAPLDDRGTSDNSENSVIQFTPLEYYYPYFRPDEEIYEYPA